MPTNNVTCPRCRRVLEMPADSQGREVRCPECLNVFLVETTTAITSQPATPTSVRVGDLSPYRDESDSGPFDDLNVDNRFASFNLYRAGGGLATAAKVFFVLILLADMAFLGTNYLQYELSLRLLANVPVPDAELNSNNDRQMALGVANFIIFIVTAIVFVVWFYRVHANLVPLGARNLTYTPGWAAGSWFVPILNLYRPVQIAQEIWRNSDPDAVDSGRIREEAASNSVLIGFWWASWIVCNVLSNIALRMPVNSPITLQSATQMQMVSGATSMIAASLALIVIWNIDARQTARADAIHAAINRGSYSEA
jgi:hypothetical protein